MHDIAYVISHFKEWGIFDPDVLYDDRCSFFIIILEKMIGLHRECKNIFLNIARHCYLQLVVMVGWVIFRADTLTYT